jgi:uroporphyrinogen-III synthase
MSFSNLNVLCLESRRAKEMEALIVRYQGVPFMAPSVREIPLEDSPPVFDYAEKLFRGEFDMHIFLTGVGLGYLRDMLMTRYSKEQFVDALSHTTIVARGPKPSLILRELGVPIHINIGEPNTWKEILESLQGRIGNNIAVQEYGRSNRDLLQGLTEMGASVTPVNIYRWDLPEDIGPLQEAARQIAEVKTDVVLFATSIQLVHLLQIADQMSIGEAVRESLMRHVVTVSIGPVMTQAMRDEGLEPDIIPAHPKMGPMVKAAAEQAGKILAQKRANN